MTKKKSKKKWIWIIIILVIILAAAGFLVYRSKQPVITPVDAEPVVRMDLEQTVDVKGLVEGTDSADVYSTSTKRIAEIMVKEGDRVKTGDRLARLEEDENQVGRERSEMNLDNAKLALDNATVLFEAGAISRQDYLDAETRYKEAQLSALELESDEDQVYVTSPIDGTVTRIYASAGKIAGGSSAGVLFRIENIDRLQMRIQVSEYDINKVKLGQEVRITSEITKDEEISGKVTSIAPTGEEKNPGTGNMVIPVTVTIDQNQKGLFAGVTAKASIITGKADNALAIPVDSLAETEEDPSPFVFAVRNGVLCKVYVTPVLEGDFYIAVEEDGLLAEGDMVVIAPELTMEDGMNVSINENMGDLQIQE